MKVTSKILAHKLLIVVIFWSIGLSAVSWSSPKAQPQDTFNQNPSGDKSAYLKNDSLAALLCDKFAPWFENLDPDSEQQHVALNSAIKFTVVDSLRPKRQYEWDHFGVDTNKIFINIKTRFWEVDSVKPHKITLVDSIFRVNCEYYPSQPFDWSDTIIVTLSATDVSYLKNHADTTYYFYTVRDTIAPVLTPIYPERNATGIPIDTSISIRGTEIGRGVVFDSIKLWINGIPIPLTPENIVGDAWSFKVYSTPGAMWDYSDTVRVACTAKDIDGNADMLNYWFVIEQKPDKIPPKIEVIRPKPDATGVDTTTDIVLYVRDDVLQGVNTATVELLVDKQVIPHNLIDFIKDDMGDTVRYQPPTPLPRDYQVDVYFKVADFAANWADTSYWFKTDTIPNPQDTRAPLIEVIRPKPDATGVDTLTDIVLYVTDGDGGTGVDTAAVELVVDNQVIPDSLLDFIKIGNGDTLRYQPPAPLPSDYQVDVKFKVADFDKNWADTSYWFKTDMIPIPLTDKIRPVIEVIRPLPNETGVDTLTDIVLYVTDGWRRVDTTTVELVVDNQVIPDSLLDFIKIGNGDTVRYQPPAPLPSDYQVDVKFKVADFDKNWADTSYWFKTDTIPIPQDTRAPLIEVIRPKPDATGVDTLTDIVLYVTDGDGGTGVDTAAVELVVDKQVIPHSLIDFIKDDMGDTVRYQPPIAFPSDYQVDVYFEVADFAANWADTSYWFKTDTIPISQDTRAPLIELIRPKPDATGVDTLTDIVLYVTDGEGGTGVDTSIVELVVDKQVIPHSLIDFIKAGFGDTVRYQPPTAFPSDYQVAVDFSVKDFARNLADTSYWFVTVKKDTQDNTIPPDLYITTFENLTKGKIKVNQQIKLSATVKAINADCTVPFYVCFYLNDFDNERANVQINSIKKGDSSEAVTTDFTVPIEGTHKIYVYVDARPFPLGVINEEDELNNADSLTIDVEPELIVSPNPFTPNDDTYNDESEFNFEQFDVDQPSVKIFDIHGRKVRELDRPSGKIFTWDGRDGNGSHLLPGMYLYIFSDKERARARGCIVIVR